MMQGHLLRLLLLGRMVDLFWPDSRKGGKSNGSNAKMYNFDRSNVHKWEMNLIRPWPQMSASPIFHGCVKQLKYLLSRKCRIFCWGKERNSGYITWYTWPIWVHWQQHNSYLQCWGSFVVYCILEGELFSILIEHVPSFSVSGVKCEAAQKSKWQGA